MGFVTIYFKKKGRERVFHPRRLKEEKKKGSQHRQSHLISVECGGSPRRRQFFVRGVKGQGVFVGERGGRHKDKMPKP